MRTLFLKSLLMVVGLAIILVPAGAALAEEKPEDGKKVKHVIIGDVDQNITINTDGSELTVIFTEDGKSKVAVVDMEQVGMIVGEGLSEVTAALKEMQMDVRLGKDNSLSFALDDEEWAVDINAIMAEVGEALSGAFEGMDTDGWTSHNHHRTIHLDEDDEDQQEQLEAEMNALRDELQALKDELARLKKIKDE